MNAIRSLVVLMFCPLIVDAGPHLGMKKACKEYGEAWISGNRDALRGMVTPRFARSWDRLTEKEFQAIPRHRESPQITGESKGNGYGTVTISTTSGPMTLVLVGGGFNWLVDDIIKPGVDGQPLSVAASLDTTSTVREFVEIFGEKDGQRDFRPLISTEMRQAFDLVPDDESKKLLRQWFENEGAQSEPAIVVRGDRAAISLVPASGEDKDYVTFQLVRELGDWKVDDIEFNMAKYTIPSWRQSLPLLVAVLSLREFVRDPKEIAPESFASGKLLNEFSSIHRGVASMPATKLDGMLNFEVTGECQQANIRFKNASFTVYLDPRDSKHIDRINVSQHGEDRDLAGLLATNRAITMIPGTQTAARLWGIFETVYLK